MEKYFFDDGRTCWGPVKASRIIELYQEGILSSQSRIRICGQEKWLMLGEMDTLYAACRESKANLTANAESQTSSLRRLLAAILAPKSRNGKSKSSEPISKVLAHPC